MRRPMTEHQPQRGAEVGVQSSEVGGRRSEVGGRRSEGGGRRSEGGGRRAEVRGRRSVDGARRTEVRGRRSEDGGARVRIWWRQDVPTTVWDRMSQLLECVDEAVLPGLFGEGGCQGLARPGEVGAQVAVFDDVGDRTGECRGVAFGHDHAAALVSHHGS